MSIAHCRRPAVLRFSCTAACIPLSLQPSLSQLTVVAGLLVQNTLKFLLNFGNFSPYLNEYILAMPARDAARRAKMEAEDLLATEGPLHADNEWNISVLGDNELDSIDAASSGLFGNSRGR
ncbi:Ubiquitin-like modifier-activating enzyme 5 [Morella rubra]|uniref:Ubiquitin-like modifier-activating enzyme 5 n=1 Tax=Morella rubra TaxID=262757 RepID=A0A6A1WEX1_9ROSI|nr:Ubiquitin-like modifier-activating enzyme 5 [Morella rubra]